MAARRAAPKPEPEPELPTTTELQAVLARWHNAEAARKAAYAEETAARVALVDVLHRAGLKGFSL